ncbi:MAG: hypothetical protein KDC34_16470 [Saprospiraceae bacterium]|nr:hypothetical protein [Saprospiraceae bacterium]
MTSAQQLEQIFGVSFQQQADIKGLRQFHANNTFCVNEAGEIIGICACENDFESLTIPKASALKQLQYLNISDNKSLRRLDIEIALPELKHLDLSDCKLEELKLLSGFEKLEWLDVSRNKLTVLTIQGNLPHLSFLDVSDNKIEKLSIPDGGQLKYLYAQKNQLTEFNISPNATTLEVLNLKENKLDNLPISLSGLGNLEALYVQGNPLSAIPQENIAKGAGESSLENIRNYLLSITEDQAIDNDEIKLVLLGNSTSGKSSLLRFLMTGAYDKKMPSTHGIQNELWSLKDKSFKVNVWDFGGQEFYHATHRLFLSNNAVSLVVFDQDTNFQGERPTKILLYHRGELVEGEILLQHFPFSYWLDSLQHFCQQQSETTLLVQSKMDKEEAKSIGIPDTDKKKYQIPEENIFRISVEGAHGKVNKYLRSFDAFKEDLIDTLQHAKSAYQISTKWLEIKEALRARGEEDVMLSYATYVLLCERIRPNISQAPDVGKKSILDTLTNYLHGISVILYYPEIEALKDIVFINPEWVTNIIYKVLDYEVKEKEGKLDKAHIEQIIQKDKLASDLTVDELIALMMQFELIFQVKNLPDNFIAPQYLPLENSEKDSKSYAKVRKKCDKHAFTIRYPVFMPRSVMTRLICRYGNLSEDIFWKNGIVFEKENVIVHLECDQAFQIKVEMDELDSRVASAIFSDIQEINERHPNIEVSVNGEDFIKIAHLADHPNTNPQIQATNGNWLNVNDFKIVSGEHGMKGDFENLGDNSAIVDQLHQLVKLDQLIEALELLAQRVPGHLTNNAILLQLQLQSLKNKKRKGVITVEEEEVNRNNIADRILDIIDELS